MHLSVLSIQDFLLENAKEWEEKQRASWNNMKCMCVCTCVGIYTHMYTSMYVCVAIKTVVVHPKSVQRTVSALPYCLWRHRYYLVYIKTLQF